MSKLVLTFLFLSLGVVLSASTLAQNGATAPIVAPAEQQAAIKPLVEAQVKAVAELEKAIAALPQKAAFDQAREKTAFKAAAIMAEMKLNHLEYEPKINDKGELIFEKIVKK